MQKSFHFVDNTKIDSFSRKSIRSHVMKGKNAGRKMSRLSRVTAIGCSPPRRETAAKNCPHRRQDENAAYDFLEASRVLGSMFLTIEFPIELTPHSARVVTQFFNNVLEKLYPRHLGFSATEAKTQWLEVILTDEGASHCSMALMEASNGFFFNSKLSSPESLQHVSKTYALMRKRLEGATALSDGTIGMVLMLILQEQIRRDDIEAAVHFEGLKKMIQLRGGLGQLEGNLPLLLKICKVEITRCLQSGQPLIFYRDRLSRARTMLDSTGLTWDWQLARFQIQYRMLDAYLQNILRDAMAFSTILNNLPKKKNIGLSTFQEIIVSICSRLISFRPLRSSFPITPVNSAYQVGLLLFMMTLFLKHGRLQAMDYDLILVRLEDSLNVLQELDTDLVLWLTCLGTIWVKDDPNKSHFDGKIRYLNRNTGILEWSEVHKRLSKFPWVNVVHEKQGRSAWTSALAGD